MKARIVVFLSLVAIPVALTAGYGDSASIPQWIKGNAGLWSEGTISDSEFVNSLQYLLGAGILELPITEARAASSPISDEDTAQSFVVHFSQGPFAEPVSIYSYSLYQQKSRTTQDTSLAYTKNLERVPSFHLQSLPSPDKQPVYEIVERYLDHQYSIPDFFVDVEILTGTGDVLQTWKYEKCKVVDYWVYSNTSKTQYNFSSTDGIEIRDDLLLSCVSQRLEV